MYQERMVIPVEPRQEERLSKTLLDVAHQWHQLAISGTRHVFSHMEQPRPKGSTGTGVPSVAQTRSSLWLDGIRTLTHTSPSISGSDNRYKTQLGLLVPYLG